MSARFQAFRRVRIVPFGCILLVTMLSRWTPHFSSGTRLIALGAAAVLLPAIVISVVQYRSLVDLERKTKAASQQNLHDYLQGLARRARDDLQTAAKQSFSSLDLKNLSPENMDQVESRLAAIGQSHPGTDFLFVVSHCTCRGKRFAVFYAPGQLRRIYDGEFRPGSEVTQLIEQYDRASAARSPAEANQEAMFGQAVCSIFPDGRAGAPPVYVFYSLRE